MSVQETFHASDVAHADVARGIAHQARAGGARPDL